MDAHMARDDSCTVHAWLAARLKRPPAPPYIAAEIAAYHARQSHRLPPELCWYLENVSREMLLYCHPVLFALGDTFDLGKCVIPADRTYWNWDDVDDDHTQDLVDGMMRVGDGGCSFSSEIVVDPDSPHYGSVWDSDGDMVCFEHASFVDYLRAALRERPV